MLIFCLVILLLLWVECYEWRFMSSNIMCVCFSSQLYQFLFWDSVVWYIYILNVFFFLVNWAFYYHIMPQLYIIFTILFILFPFYSAKTPFLFKRLLSLMFQVMYVYKAKFLKTLLFIKVTNSMKTNFSNKRSELIDLYNWEI